MEEENTDVTGTNEVKEAPKKEPAIVFANTTKPWWVKIRSIASNADGTIHGVGSDNKLYIWHHSFVHAGKWVLHVTGR